MAILCEGSIRKKHDNYLKICEKSFPFYFESGILSIDEINVRARVFSKFLRSPFFNMKYSIKPQKVNEKVVLSKISKAKLS